MGRHSAPDEDDNVQTDVLPDVEHAADVLVAESPGQGRHASPEPDAAERPKRVRRPPNADLRLLRENPALRARCAAAAIVPFVLYTAALLVIGRTDVYLLWFWIPAVAAGVLAGLLIDLAARHPRAETRPDQPPRAEGRPDEPE
jgi:hypothetical protein